MSPEIGVRYSGGLRGKIWGESDRPIISVPGPLMISLACRWACLPKHQPRHKFSPNPSFVHPTQPKNNTHIGPISCPVAVILPLPTLACCDALEQRRRAARSGVFLQPRLRFRARTCQHGATPTPRVQPGDLCGPDLCEGCREGYVFPPTPVL
jgi:hypothetical protein